MIEEACKNGIKKIYSITKSNIIDKIYDNELTPKIKGLMEELEKSNSDADLVNMAKEALGSHHWNIGHDLADDRFWKIPYTAGILEQDAGAMMGYFKDNKEVAAKLDDISIVARNMAHIVEEHMPKKNDEPLSAEREILASHGIEIPKFKTNSGMGCTCGQKWEEWETGRIFEGLDFSDFYGKPQIGYRTLLWCSRDQPKGAFSNVLVAEDERSVKEIGREIKGASADLIQKILDENRKVQSVHVLVGKKIEKPKIEIKSYSVGIPKETVEQFKLTDSTIVKTMVWGPHMEGVNENLTVELQNLISDELKPHGYKTTMKSSMYGWGGEDKAIFGSGLELTSGELYVTELMESQPELACGRTKNQVRKSWDEYKKTHAKEYPLCGFRKEMKHCAVEACERE
jgi:hypothetical protein